MDSAGYFDDPSSMHAPSIVIENMRHKYDQEQARLKKKQQIEE